MQDLRFYRNKGIFSCCNDFVLGFSFLGGGRRYVWIFALFVCFVGFGLFVFLLNGDVLVLRQVIVFGFQNVPFALTGSVSVTRGTG